MGNCSCLHDRRKRPDEPSDQKLRAMETDEPAHEGIKTVPVEKVCEFSTGSVLCICIVTWNMNGKLSSGDFEELVGRDRKFDLLVVGLQEAPRRGVRQMLEAAVEETHSLVGEATMKSLQLFLFGHRNAVPYLEDIKVDKHAVGGLGGLIGRKKGAVAIYINFNGIRMVFISCHLSAHAHKVEKRNLQCEHISHSLFSVDGNPCERPCHLTVWLGDLNYRIQGISNQPARSLIRKNLHNYKHPQSTSCSRSPIVTVTINIEGVGKYVNDNLCRFLLAKINFCKRLKEDKYSVDIARGRYLSSLHTNTMLGAATMIPATRSEYQHGLTEFCSKSEMMTAFRRF